MLSSTVRWCLGFLQVGFLLLAGTAQADGGAFTSSAPGRGGDQGGAQVAFQCKGGVRVRVTQGTNTARVDFAGRTRTLNLTRDPGGTSFRNEQVTWFTRGQAAYMKNNRTGQLELSDCRPQ